MVHTVTERPQLHVRSYSLSALLSPKLLAWFVVALKSAVRPSRVAAPGPMSSSPRGGTPVQRPGSARPTARPVQRPASARRPGAENRQERFAVSPRMRPDELPKFGLQYHAKYPERRPQSASPRSPRRPGSASPRAAPLTTARVQSSHGFEPAGFKHPCRRMVKAPPWQCPSSASVPPQGAPGSSGQPIPGRGRLTQSPATASKASHSTAFEHSGGAGCRMRSGCRGCSMARSAR